MAGRKTVVMAALAGVLGILLCFPADIGARWLQVHDHVPYQYTGTYSNNPLGWTWHEAEAECMKEGGHVISFEYPEEDMYVSHLPEKAFSESAYLWIGMNRLGDDHRWKWSDNSSDIREFGSKLGLGDRNKKCGALLIERSKLDKENVTLKTVKLNCDMGVSLYMCKRKINDTTPKTNSGAKNVSGAKNGTSLKCPLGWRDAGTKRCYKSYELSTGLDWKTAEATCLSLPYDNPNLACVTTLEEARLLERMVTQRTPARFWFGLFRESAVGRWMWADNTEVNYTNFHVYLEKDFDYGEGVVDNRAFPRGSWDLVSGRDGLRSQVKRYICQVEKRFYEDWIRIFKILQEIRLLQPWMKD